MSFDLIYDIELQFEKITKNRKEYLTIVENLEVRKNKMTYISFIQI